MGLLKSLGEEFLGMCGRGSEVGWGLVWWVGWGGGGWGGGGGGWGGGSGGRGVGKWVLHYDILSEYIRIYHNISGGMLSWRSGVIWF